MAEKTSLKENAVLVTLKVRHTRGKKIDKKVSNEVEENYKVADDVGRYQKMLFPKTDLKEIRSYATRAKEIQATYTVPWNDRGADLLPIKNLDIYQQKMDEAIEGHKKAVADFIMEYPSKVEAAKKRLKDMFRADDYPSVEAMKEKFAIEISYDPVPEQGDFRLNLSADKVKTLKDGFKSRQDVLVSEAMDNVWARLYEVIKHAYDKLSDKDAIFRDSLTTKIDELVKTLPALNIANDQNLAKIVELTGKKLSGLDPEGLREDEKFRSQTAKAAEAVLKDMKKFMPRALEF